LWVISQYFLYLPETRSEPLDVAIFKTLKLIPSKFGVVRARGSDQPLSWCAQRSGFGVDLFLSGMIERYPDFLFNQPFFAYFFGGGAGQKK